MLKAAEMRLPLRDRSGFASRISLRDSRRPLAMARLYRVFRLSSSPWDQVSIVAGSRSGDGTTKRGRGRRDARGRMFA